MIRILHFLEGSQDVTARLGQSVPAESWSLWVEADDKSAVGELADGPAGAVERHLHSFAKFGGSKWSVRIGKMSEDLSPVF